MSSATEIVPTYNISGRIHSVRDVRVMLDTDLAEIYKVSPKRLNELLRRNVGRFPDDFAFQLTEEEWASLRSQIATLKIGRGGAQEVPSLRLYRARRLNGSEYPQQPAGRC